MTPIFMGTDHYLCIPILQGIELQGYIFTCTNVSDPLLVAIVFFMKLFEETFTFTRTPAHILIPAICCMM